MGVGCHFLGTKSDFQKEKSEDESFIIEITFNFKGESTSISYNSKNEMKQLFESYATKIGIDKNKLLFIYDEDIIKETDSFEQKASQQDLRLKKMNILVIEKIKFYQNNNKNKEFQRNPDLKYKSTITDTNDSTGINDIFEVFFSFIDNQEYIVSPNKNHNLDIFQLFPKKKIISVSGHYTNITSVRYFIDNKYKDEYLISSDCEMKVIIFHISNNYKIKCIINTSYSKIGLIYSCLLIFPQNSDNNFIITSKENSSDNNNRDKSGTKIYSLNNGEFIRSINNTNNYSIYYLLSWYNKKNHKYYIIQLANNKIIINNLLEDELYSELIHEPEHYHNSGYIYSKNNNDYLCSTSTNGYINIWDLYQKSLFKSIYISNYYFMHIIEWNNKFLIVADYQNKSFKIIDIEKEIILSDFKNIHDEGVVCIKKIFHPIFDESLLTAGKDGIIKLWCI